jgi:hypothetical protein
MYSECSRAKATAGNYQRMQSAPILPNYLGLPFRILVSPFVHFDPENRLTDIMMFNSRNLGALIVDEDPHVKSWEDGQYNIMNMSVEETQGLPSLPASCSTYPVSSSSTATPASRARGAGRRPRHSHRHQRSVVSGRVGPAVSPASRSSSMMLC